MANTSVDGLISGLSTSDVISNLMRVEKLPQDRLKARVTQTNSIVTTYQGLNSRFAAIKDAAKALTATGGFDAATATSSDSSVATVTAGADALAASLSFTVDRLAAAHTITSAGAVNGTSAVIAPAGTKVLVGATRALGVGTLVSQSGLSTGEHTLEVTQATQAASHDGSVLASSVTVAAGATLEIATDGTTGTTQTLSLTAGTYTRTQLAEMVTAASGGSLTASIDGDGSLRLATTAEGSAAKLAVTGGTGLAALGFSTTAVASGVDGIVKLDGVANTVTSAMPGYPITFLGTSGATIAATLTGGLREGSSRFALIDVGDGTLGSVVRSINTVVAGVTASAVQVGTGLYRLQLSARATGNAGALSVDPAAFSGLGTLETLTAAQDAKLTVGSGPSSYSITSSSNDAELLAGVTVKLQKTSATPVSVEVRADSNAVADRVGKLVDAVSGALSVIRQQSAYDSNRKTGGPLMGDQLARQLQQDLFGALGSNPASNGVTLGYLGITVTRTGTLEFDREKFKTAFAAQPNDVKAVLGQGSAGNTGLAGAVAKIADAATDSVTGSITTSITGAKALATTLGDQVTAWDRRLSVREQALRKTFSDMESRLGGLRNQSSWLSSQLARLPSSNG